MLLIPHHASESQAKRSGAVDMRNNPEYGVYNPTTMKIAQDTHIAATRKVLIAAALRGANKPQLRKIAVSQEIITKSNGLNAVVAVCSTISNRIFDKLFNRPSASDLIILCPSSLAGRSRT